MLPTGTPFPQDDTRRNSRKTPDCNGSRFSISGGPRSWRCQLSPRDGTQDDQDRDEGAQVQGTQRHLRELRMRGEIWLLFYLRSPRRTRRLGSGIRHPEIEEIRQTHTPWIEIPAGFNHQIFVPYLGSNCQSTDGKRRKTQRSCCVKRRRRPNSLCGSNRPRESDGSGYEE